MDPSDPIEVHLLQVPLALHVRSREHTEELQREFALIHHGGASDHSVPGRLLDLVQRLRARFGSASSEQTAMMDAANARGVERLDVTFRVPREAAPAAIALEEMLSEADEYCRSGDLLTLATPDDLVAFRRWFLDEFVRQAAGQAPRSWDDYVRAVPVRGAPG